MTKYATNSRRAFLAALATAALAGCSGTDVSRTTTAASEADSPSNSSTSTSTNTTSGNGPPIADSTLSLPKSGDELSEHVLSGGPPKDGIPAIEEPSFESASEAADRLNDFSVVFGVERNGESKAYPQYILVWHEICNDEIGGDPVSVTYCPLTGTALGFERGETTFGVSGRLVNNNLIMYDRGTEQWWPQVLSTTIPGPWHDDYQQRSLQDFRVVWTSWGRWVDAYPDTLVLTEDTGNLRNYGDDPYGRYGDDERFGYYEPGRPPMFESLSVDDRFEPKRVVIGARTPDGAVAFLKDSLREQRVMAGTTSDDAHVVAVYDQTLDTGYVYANPDEVAFDSGDDEYVAPDGTAYPAAELPLDPVHAFDAMWFAWNGFYPESTVHD